MTLPEAVRFALASVLQRQQGTPMSHLFSVAPSTLRLAILGLAALALAWLMTAGGVALAGPQFQDSPVAAPQPQLSPPTADTPTPAATPIAAPTSAALGAPTAPEATGSPPFPVAGVAVALALLALAALAVALLRRKR